MLSFGLALCGARSEQDAQHRWLFHRVTPGSVRAIAFETKRRKLALSSLPERLASAHMMYRARCAALTLPRNGEGGLAAGRVGWGEASAGRPHPSLRATLPFRGGISRRPALFRVGHRAVCQRQPVPGRETPPEIPNAMALTPCVDLLTLLLAQSAGGQRWRRRFSSTFCTEACEWIGSSAVNLARHGRSAVWSLTKSLSQRPDVPCRARSCLRTGRIDNRSRPRVRWWLIRLAPNLGPRR